MMNDRIETCTTSKQFVAAMAWVSLVSEGVIVHSFMISESKSSSTSSSEETSDTHEDLFKPLMSKSKRVTHAERSELPCSSSDAADASDEDEQSLPHNNFRKRFITLSPMVLLFGFVFLMVETVNLVYVGFLFDRNVALAASSHMSRLPYGEWMFTAVFVGSLVWDLFYFVTGSIGALFLDATLINIHFLLAALALPLLPWLAIHIDMWPNVTILSIRIISLYILEKHVVVQCTRAIPMQWIDNPVHGVRVFHFSLLVAWTVRVAEIVFYAVNGTYDAGQVYSFASAVEMLTLLSLLALFSRFLRDVGFRANMYLALSLCFIMWKSALVFTTGIEHNDGDGFLVYLPLFGRAPNITPELFDRRRWYAMEVWYAVTVMSIVMFVIAKEKATLNWLKLASLITWVLQLAYAVWMFFATWSLTTETGAAKHSWYAKELVVSVLGAFLVAITAVCRDFITARWDLGFSRRKTQAKRKKHM